MQFPRTCGVRFSYRRRELSDIAEWLNSSLRLAIGRCEI